MRTGDFNTARLAQFAMSELNQVMFMQSNPIPVKAACAALGWMNNELRLPLLPMQGEVASLLFDVMRSFKGEKLELADN